MDSPVPVRPAGNGPEGETGTTVRYQKTGGFLKPEGALIPPPKDAVQHRMGVEVHKGTPKINFELVEQLKEALAAPVVIHGGTGLSEETFRRLIRGGGAKVNVSTAIKHAYLDTCRDYFKDAPEKADPIGFDRILSHAIEQTVKDHMIIFTKDRA